MDTDQARIDYILKRSTDPHYTNTLEKLERFVDSSVGKELGSGYDGNILHVMSSFEAPPDYEYIENKDNSVSFTESSVSIWLSNRGDSYRILKADKISQIEDTG